MKEVVASSMTIDHMQLHGCSKLVSNLMTFEDAMRPQFEFTVLYCYLLQYKNSFPILKNIRSVLLGIHEDIVIHNVLVTCVT